MTPDTSELSEFHWLMEMVQSIDAGLVVIDREYRVKLWNGFMENHSGLVPGEVRGRPLFELFDELPEAWFRRKVETVFKLNNRAFTTWEQRPWIFKFHNNRPLTGTCPFMYQNMTIIPLTSVTCSVDEVCLIIYDVTDIATNKQLLNRLNGELENLSRTDRLSGLTNRGHWEEQLSTEFERFRRTGVTATLVMFDIDHFKRVNDTFGHQAGDEVIRRVAECLQKTARTTDLTGRYGGEEFGVVLVSTDTAQATYFAERLRKRIEQLTIEFDGQEISCTVSLGIAACHKGTHSVQQWLQQADQALYRSKAEGRNRFTLADG